MTPLLVVAVLLIPASVIVALYLSGRLARAQTPALEPAQLAPAADALLALVLRANQALGVWVLDPARGTTLQALHSGLADSQRDLVLARLEPLRGHPAGGTEVLDAGILVHVGSRDMVAAAILPRPAERPAIDRIRGDLLEAMARLRREPVLQDVARAQERPSESAESVAMRLAHQIERLLDTEVAVALARPQGVQVLGVSLRSDPRLLLALAAPGSPLELIGRGVEPGPVISDDPLGRAVRERRRARPRAVILPIPGSRFTVGAVVVDTPDGQLPAGTAMGELVQALRSAGPRLDQAIDRQDLEETTRTDPLTGLRNRRGLDAALARVDRTEGAMIYADLDYFKKLNDALGHPAGDAALVHFARLIAQGIRSGDVAARIGGEEFAIWLPGATLLEGAGTAERIRAEFETTSWAWQGSQWPLTASFGVAGCPETVPAISHLAARADDALYQAKVSGRNRVITAM
jgi:diguanylate cyclase (GGDEF)-like protein